MLTHAAGVDVVESHEAAVDRALAEPGLILVIGGPDTGKSTVALQLANRAVDRGDRVAIIDADVGQSDIGPPGTVGLALPDVTAESIAAWRPVAMAFVGSTAPPGRLLEIVVGARRLADEAWRRGADRVIVDTSGLIHGALGMKLKLAKMEALQPTRVLALQRGRELEPVLRMVTAACHANIMVLAPPAGVRAKSPGLRRVRRIARFAEFLRDARVHEIDPHAVTPTDGWLFTGRPLVPAHLRAASRAIGSEVVHGEDTTDGIRLVTRGVVTLTAGSELREIFGRRRVAATPASAFHNLLVGLMEDGGRLAEIGLLEQVDFKRGLLRIRSQLRSLGALRVLRYGRLRVRLDGTEIGPVRPGDL